MSADEIAERVLEGSEYERAKATVRQTFAVPIGVKIRAAVAGLLSTVLLAPAVLLRRDLIVEYEGIDTAVLVIGRLVLVGILTTFSAGLVLVRHRRVLLRTSFSRARARRFVRVEDLLMWFVLLGTTFAVVGTGLAVVGLVSGTAVEWLYSVGVHVYQPTTAFGIDVRLVSALGGVLALLLLLVDPHTTAD